MDTNLMYDAPQKRLRSKYGELVAEAEAMFDGDLEQATIEAKTEIDCANARLLVLTNELDRRCATESSHGLSTTEWLRHSCRMTAREASGTVKAARALARMPIVAVAAVAGTIVTSGMKLLARTRDRHPEEFATHEEAFTDMAESLGPADLRGAVSEWEQDVDFEEALSNAEHDVRNRELFFNQAYPGGWDMHGRFGVADGHVINTALQGHVQRSYLERGDNRSIYERLADAEVAIHRFWLDHNTEVETSGGEKPHITVTIRHDVLTGTTRLLPELDGYAIDPATLRRWACDAGIVPIVIGSGSQPIDVGRRTRTIPPALRRALDLRDRGCVWPGCGAPVSWCDAHHIVHWADGGDTNLGNTQLLCRKHHTRTHRIEAARPREP